MGARLSTLLRAFVANGFVAPAHLPLAVAMVLSATMRLPFSALDRLHLEFAGSKMPPAAPVFIVGHWRSGTTHLHNLMARSPLFGQISPIASGLPDEILTLGTWLRPWLERALPEDRHVDRVAVRPSSPQEDEIPLANIQQLSVFHALYFPKRFQRLIDRGVFFDGCTAAEIATWCRSVRTFVAKIVLHQGKPLLLIKNPVYTCRLALLRTLWPEARFVHIRRNPYDVFASTRHYYRHLLPTLALQPFHHVDIERFVLETFVRLMRRYDEESVTVPGDRLYEITYERLCRAPLDVLQEIHEQLRLPDWDLAHDHVKAYLASIEGYPINQHAISAAEREMVDAAWRPYVSRWQEMLDL